MMSAVEGEETAVPVENSEAEDNSNEVAAEKHSGAEKQRGEEGTGEENRKALEKPPVAICPMPEEEKGSCALL